MSALKEDLYLRNIKYQIIKGKIITNMAPPPSPNHNIISNELNVFFKNFLKGKKCRVYHDSNSIRLDIIQKEKNIKLPDECKKDSYIPDVMIVCDRTIDTINGVTGAPTLVIEVLSKGTMEYDITIKKEVYELIGVEEYWIVNPQSKSIEIYVLKNGKYFLWNIYHQYSQDELNLIETENEYLKTPQVIITEFSPYSFPDLIIKVDDVFDDLIE